jgi:tetratricopeptide (TPR) repeat protein
MLTGTIGKVGSNYVLGVNAVSCATGDSLASEQGQAASREKVLQSLGEVASRLRRKLGESLGSVQKYDAPVEQATTASLEALQDYSLSLKTWNQKGEEAAIPFLQRATELDPEFAMAWARLGTAYFNISQDTNGGRATNKAYELRGRVSEPERFYIESRYFERVTREFDKLLTVLELWKQTYPQDISVYLTGAHIYGVLGQHEKSLELENQALRLQPTNGFIYANLAFGHLNLNQFDKAKEVLKQAQALNIYNPWFESVKYQLAFLDGDAPQMQRAVAAVEGRPALESFFWSLQADSEAYIGHVAKARDFTRRAVQSADHSGDHDSADGYKVAEALREADFGLSTSARERASTLVARSSNRLTRVLAALALARIGDTRPALDIATQLYREHPLDTLLNSYWIPTVRAAVELRKENPSEAIKLLQVVTPYELSLQPTATFIFPYPAYVRGMAYLQAGQGHEAEVEFQKILDHPGMVLNCSLGALAHLELGRAYALEAGIQLTHGARHVTDQPRFLQASQEPNALAKARASYEDFFALWKNADGGTPVLNHAKAEYAKLK